MLSFMREQGSENSARSASTDTGPHDVHSPDDTGSQEFLTVATTRKTLRRSTIIVIGLLVVGLVCLWVMIRRIQPQAAAAAQQSQAEQVKIEQAIGRLTGSSSEMVGRMDAIVKKFYEFSDVFQVKVGELSKNPFEVEKPVDELKNVVVTEDPRAQSDMIRYQRLQRQASTLRLLSIMRSQSGPCCMINDQILRQGDKIEDFTVRQIGNNYVDLVASASSGSETEEMKITLKLSQ